MNREDLIAPNRESGTTHTARAPHSPRLGRCVACRERALVARSRAARRRRILRDILLFAFYSCVVLSLFAAGALGDMWLGWSEWLLAFGLACFADQVDLASSERD